MDEKLDDSYVEGEDDGEKELIGNQEEIERLKSITEYVQQECGHLARTTEVNGT